MIGVNPLRTKVLITTDEVIFHAATDHEIDPRVLMQSIIVAEKRFIKPMLGAVAYKAITDNKNILVTLSNKAALQIAANTGRPADREVIVLNTGDYVNSDDYLPSTQKSLWQDHLHKIIAECVWFVSLPVNRARFTSKGVIKNYPDSIASTQESVTVDLSDLKHLMDRGLKDRIDPLMDDMHEYLCDVAYPDYDKDCGCNSNGTSKTKKTSIILGMYDDDEDDCRPCSRTTVSGSGVVSTSQQNEVLYFENVNQVLIPWTTARKAKYGDAGQFTVEVLNEDGLTYSQVTVDIQPDDIVDTQYYTVFLGGNATGRVIMG